MDADFQRRLRECSKILFRFCIADQHIRGVARIVAALGHCPPRTHLMQFLYNIPGMEDVEDVIVSSGPNTWPNWRNFSDRIIQPGDIVFMDLAALTWNGYKSCYYRTYCVAFATLSRPCA
jgi:hypothetical protein